MHLHRLLHVDHEALRAALRSAPAEDPSELGLRFHQHVLREERRLLTAIALELGADWAPLRLVRLQHADLALELARWSAEPLAGPRERLARRVRRDLLDHLALEESVLFPVAVLRGLLPPPAVA